MLRVDAPQSFGAASLAPALGAFARRYPEIVLELTLNNRVVDLIEEGYDASIRTGDLPDSGLVARKLAPYALVACAAPGYVSTRGLPAHPDHLRDHVCLRFRPRAPFDTWRFRASDGALIEVEVRGSLVSNSGDALRAAAVAEAGIILQAGPTRTGAQAPSLHRFCG